MIISTFASRFSGSAVVAGQANADSLDYASGWNERTAGHSDEMKSDEHLRDELGSKLPNTRNRDFFA